LSYSTRVNKPDIVIIGGGVVGSSIAFNLLQDGYDGRITVMERDSSYQFASSALAIAGGTCCVSRKGPSDTQATAAPGFSASQARIS